MAEAYERINVWGDVSLKRRKKKKRWLLWGILLLAVTFMAGALYFLRIQSVTYVGNENVDEETLNAHLFQKPYSLNLVYCYFWSHYGDKPEIPFVETYRVEFTAWDRIRVEVYEKQIAGYVEYKGYNIYFDREGIVVESSKDKLEHVVRIEGLPLGRIVLYEKLPVEKERIFPLILTVTQILGKYQIDVDQIQFDDQWNIWMQVDGIMVQLGNDQYLNEKIAKLNDLLPLLVGKKGDLHLEDFREDTEIFRFTMDDGGT
jgi:cell division protein FtsQ